MTQIPYALVRSDRKTLSLVVALDGSLTARAPRRMPKGDIEAFITQKQRWILEKQQQAQAKALRLSSFQWKEGDSLPFWGGELRICSAHLPIPVAYHGALLLPLKGDYPRNILPWMREQAKALLLPLVDNQARVMGLAPSSVAFSSARTRWGTMNAKGQMRLNLALLFCPPEVAHYVIVHELAHMRQPNHSAAFWQLVEEWLPDYRTKRLWLKRNSHLTGLLQ